MASTTFQVNGAEVSREEFQEIITTPWEELPEELKRPEGVALPPLEECPSQPSVTATSEESDGIPTTAENAETTTCFQSPAMVGLPSAIPALQRKDYSVLNWEERFTQLGYRMFMKEQQLEREYQLALQRYKGYKHFRNRVLGAVENEPSWKDKYNQGQLKKFSSAICPPLESKKAPKICVECKQNPREDGKMGEVPCGVAVTRPISTWATNHVEKVKKEHYFFDTKPVTKDSMEVSYQVVDTVPSQEWDKVEVTKHYRDGKSKTRVTWLSLQLYLEWVQLLDCFYECETEAELEAIMAKGRNLLDATPDSEDKQRLLQEWETIMTQLASSRSPTQEPREEAQEKGCSD